MQHPQPRIWVDHDRASECIVLLGQTLKEVSSVVVCGADKEAADAALAEMDIEEIEAEEEDLSERLKRIPDLAEQLRDAPPALKRQVFEAFELRIDYDKAERQIEISATVSEAVAEALETEKTLLSEGLPVTVRDIAGAGFEPATSGL